MRAFMTCAVLTVATLTITATPAFAQHTPAANLVDSWYHRYLGRHVDPAGQRDHVHALRHGTPAEVVESAILSSQEYYHRNGCTPEGFVAALYRDVLGRRPGPHEFGREVNYMLTHGRNASALRVISQRGSTIVVASSPVVVSQPPVIVHRPVVVDPIVVVPAHRHHHPHGYVAPRPGISIGIRIR